MEYDIKVIKRGCPICGGDVKGNDLIGYYCKRCNLIFPRSAIVFNNKIKGKIKSKKTKGVNFGFVGNMKTKVLHVRDCYILKKMKDKNKVYFSSMNDALKLGYRKGRCFK